MGTEESVAVRTYDSIALEGGWQPPSLTLAGSARLQGAVRERSQGAALLCKGVVERLLSVVFLILAAPLLLVIAAVVWLESPGAIVYRQRRVGRQGREFTLLKFRTMSEGEGSEVDADVQWAAASLGLPAPDAPPDRCTRLGEALRRWGVDELPQLVNVLKGDMALVGPRPERTSYVANFERHVPGYRDRHRMRPGITGWAQVHGLRGRTSLVERASRDNEYIDGWSLWLDLRILLRTPSAVLRQREQ